MSSPGGLGPGLGPGPGPGAGLGLGLGLGLAQGLVLGVVQGPKLVLAWKQSPLGVPRWARENLEPCPACRTGDTVSRQGARAQGCQCSIFAPSIRDRLSRPPFRTCQNPPRHTGMTSPACKIRQSPEPTGRLPRPPRLRSTLSQLRSTRPRNRLHWRPGRTHRGRRHYLRRQPSVRRPSPCRHCRQRPCRRRSHLRRQTRQDPGKRSCSGPKLRCPSYPHC
mmetsp:Transcript_56229/g.164305  ORF Transcript_56229/g.164305 Transcript_56229/m.164305 type:complete len:221 (-) Transcript_56229:253-915(-)